MSLSIDFDIFDVINFDFDQRQKTHFLSIKNLSTRRNVFKETHAFNGLNVLTFYLKLIDEMIISYLAGKYHEIRL